MAVVLSPEALAARPIVVASVPVLLAPPPTAVVLSFEAFAASPTAVAFEPAACE